MNILIVEDNAEMRRVIKSFVEDLTEELGECSDGAEALAAYTRQRPDWVLMDLKLKEVDGLTATRQIVAAFPEAKVVIVTSYADAALRAAAQQAGACAYVLKDQLCAVRQVLSGQADCH